MPVGTSDGQYYESDLHALFDIKPNEDAPRKAQDASKSPEVLGVADKNKLTSEAPSPVGEAVKNDPLDYTDKFNTPLTPQEETEFNKRFQPRDSYDYDMRGWFKQNQNEPKHEGGEHYVDTFKKPNHPTFSDESKYHGDQYQGGHWDMENKTFTPGATNLENHGREGLEDYFKETEPDYKLKINQQAPITEQQAEGKKYHFRFTPEEFKNKFGKDPIHNDFDEIFRFKNGDYGVHIAPPVPKPDPGVPVGSNPSASDIASMTHQQEQPNPAAPYVKGAMQFAEGGISRVLGENQPEWSKKLGEKLSSPEANAALGIFGGRYTVTAKSLAEAMEAKGMSEKSIKYMTGLERGSEGKWRSEIDDSAAKVHPEVLKSGDTHNLEDVLDHPELYKKYPDARYLPVTQQTLSLDTRGEYSPDIEHILMSDIKDKDKFKDTLLHEIQHWIQHKGGFDFKSAAEKPRGLQRTVVQQLTDKHLGEYKDALQKAIESGDFDEAVNIRKQMKKYEEYLTYRAEPREAEAHNVEKRSRFSKQQRQQVLAKETEFPSREHQLIETIKSK